MITLEGLHAMRFGYGPRAGRLPPLAPWDQLDGPDTMAQSLPGLSMPALFEMQRAFLTAQREGRNNPESGFQERRRDLARAEQEATKRSLARAVGSDTPYRERLVRFWADHFTVKARRPAHRGIEAVHVDEAIRPHVAGRFADMLRAAVLHPAMLRFLDQGQSVGPASGFGRRAERGLNENLGRELLELHTIGVDGPYDQEDVRQLAKLLTGLVVDNEGLTAFRPNRAEPGSETVLGRSYGGDRPASIEDVHAVLDDLAAHPATAAHLARKLAVHFVSDTPDEALVADLSAVYLETGGDLKAVSQALARHPAAQAPVLQKARQPFDFLVAALRALDVGPNRIMNWNAQQLRRFMLQPLAAMGQPWQGPNGPDGWDEALDRWITPQGLAARIDWAMDAPAQLRRPLPDARDFVDMALVGVADGALRGLVAASENNAEGVGLVLASPAFNRR